MPKVEPEQLVHLRRSKRHGLRKSTRIKCRKRSVQTKVNVDDFYDRDMGGYKFVCVHKDNKWHATKRARRQLKQEDTLCTHLATDEVVTNGYVVDSFFVSDGEDEEEETTEPTESEVLLAKTETYLWKEEEESDEGEWSESDQ